MTSCEQIASDYKVKYESLANAIPMGMILLNLGGEILEINQAALEVLGSPGASSTKEINMLSYQPLIEVGVADLILSCIDTKENQQKVVRYTTKWGKRICMKARACPVLDEAKNVCYVLFICEDLSEVEALKEKYWRMARTMAAIVDGIKSHYIFAKDKSGVFQVVNEAYAEMFGAKPMDLVGKTDFDLFPPDLCKKYRKDDEEVLSSCGLFDTEEEVYDPRYGANRHWRTIKSAICDELGNGVVLVGIGEDIEDRYQMRKTAAKAIEELEAFVKRTGGRGETSNVDVSN